MPRKGKLNWTDVDEHAYQAIKALDSVLSDLLAKVNELFGSDMEPEEENALDLAQVALAMLEEKRPEGWGDEEEKTEPPVPEPEKEPVSAFPTLGK